MSTITMSYPVQTSTQPSSTDKLRPWGFWATLAWFGVVSAIVFAMPYVMPHVVSGASWAFTALGIPSDTASLVLPFFILAVALTAIVMVPVLAARLGGFTACDYLALNWPHWRHVLVGFGLLATSGLVFLGLIHVFPVIDQSGMWIGQYRAVMGNPAMLALFWIGFVVAAPIGEEIIFRGFLMRGWSESRLGIAGTIVLTSLLFAAIHTQHSLPGMALVFVFAMLFAFMRWRSGSTTLAIMMHAARNLIVAVWVAMAA